MTLRFILTDLLSVAPFNNVAVATTKILKDPASALFKLKQLNPKPVDEVEYETKEGNVVPSALVRT